MTKPTGKPKRKALSKRQSSFAKEIVKSPKKPRRAAMRAGYSPASASIMAQANLRNADVQELIISEARELMANASLDAASVLINALTHKAIGVRMSAANSLLDRVGLTQKPEQKRVAGSLSVTINMNPAADPTPVIHMDMTDQEGRG